MWVMDPKPSVGVIPSPPCPPCPQSTEVDIKINQGFVVVFYCVFHLFLTHKTRTTRSNSFINTNNNVMIVKEEEDKDNAAPTTTRQGGEEPEELE